MSTRERALAHARSCGWDRQGEWGGTTLWRSLTYVGLQRRLEEWTGVREGCEGFLHLGATTYIGRAQYPRFARAYLARLRADAEPLLDIETRFGAWLEHASALEADLIGQRAPPIQAVVRYVQLHAEMQPYSYVFGYGEEQVVGVLVRERAEESGVDAERTLRAATAPPSDVEATRDLLGSPRDLRPLLERVRRQAMVRTRRRELWTRVETLMRPRLEAVGGPLVHAMTDEELALVLAGERPPRDLRLREGVAFLAWDRRAWLLPPDALAEAVAPPSAGPPDVTLVGVTGHAGVARGRVRIVTTPEQSDALVRGEILVSDMTTPELALACGRAAAIVTDRGGMLCHAAIVSRELGIPCVLGTEHATRVLRDGDLVEVDAGAGTVRRVHG